MNRKRVCALLCLSLFLMGVDSGDQVLTERESLGELEQTLQVRIQTLRSEQDFLLFQQEMYAADSKYLVLDITKKTGQLKYKDRVLKDFRFTLSKNATVDSLKPGVLVVTKKVEGKQDHNALLFGESLVIQWRRSVVPPQEANIPFITLTKSEMLSLFMAVEAGAMAYVLN